MENHTDPADPEGEDEEFDPVEFADEQSFPASDPPSSWTGGDEHGDERPGPEGS